MIRQACRSDSETSVYLMIGHVPCQSGKSALKFHSPQALLAESFAKVVNGTYVIAVYSRIS